MNGMDTVLKSVGGDSQLINSYTKVYNRAHISNDNIITSHYPTYM